MKIINKKTQDLIPYENNPRKNDDAVDALSKSIREFGFKVPIVIDKNNEIVTGHTRLKAAKKIGLSEVPCIIADDLTDDQVKAFRLVDNKVGEIATWDTEMLSAELQQIKMNLGDFEFEELCFDDEMLKIDDEEIGESSIKENILSINGTKVIMTDDECRDLLVKLDKYIDDNGVSFGFVRWLLNA